MHTLCTRRGQMPWRSALLTRRYGRHLKKYHIARNIIDPLLYFRTSAKAESSTGTFTPGGPLSRRPSVAVATVSDGRAGSQQGVGA